MIIAMFTVAICLSLLFLISVSGNEKKKKADDGQMMSAQDFLGVEDIRDRILYRTDNLCMAYIRLQPPMSSLWSKSEREMKTNTLVAECSKDRKPWSLTAVSRPMDITQLTNQYKHMRDDTSNPIRKKLLKQEIKELQNKVGAGEAIERQFYIKIWEENKDGVEQELLEHAKMIIANYESVGIVAQLVKKPDIIRFCNLVHNPEYINMEDTNDEPGMPMIVEDKEEDE